MKRLFSHPDRISGVALSAGGAVILYASSGLPFGRPNAPDAGFFPILLAILLCASGLLLFFRSFKTPPFSLEITPCSWVVLATAAAFLLYALLVDHLGFLICTIALLLALMKAYGGLRWKTSILLSVGFAVAVYVGFKELGVPLPSGILGSFWTFVTRRTDQRPTVPWGVRSSADHLTGRSKPSNGSNSAYSRGRARKFSFAPVIIFRTAPRGICALEK